MSLYSQVLLFPDRAENLDRYSTYKVWYDHWQPLSTEFKACFRDVFERGHATILLIHGEQGSGKTTFSLRLQKDFEAVRKGSTGTPKDNLWHALVGEPGEPSVIERATSESAVETIDAENGWLEELRTRYRKPLHRVRIFICDDAHKTGFLLPWTRLSVDEYLRTGASKALPLVAERMVELCRSSFQQSVFMLFSANAQLVRSLHENIEQYHRGLSRVIELPLPDARTKETIVRQNTNRLNPFTYWHCLDGAGPRGKEGVFKVLHENKGFTDSFKAVDGALKSSFGRTGRPPNQNVITLVTLGSTPADVAAFIATRDLQLDEDFRGTHVGMWTGRGKWASAIATGPDIELARRARLLESEFTLRWVALGPRATRCMDPTFCGDIGACCLPLLTFAPSVAKPKQLEKIKETAKGVDSRLAELDAFSDEFDALAERFRTLGQRRSTIYEPFLKARWPEFGRGLACYPALRPDVVLGDYVPCAIAETAGTRAAITEAITRTGRFLEFTSFLDDGMKGLEGYLRDKITAYAQMLESV